MMDRNYYSPENGHIITLQVATPAAGNNWVYTVPVRSRFMPLAISYIFTAAAVAVTRELRVAYVMAPALYIPFQFHRGVTTRQILHVNLAANYGHQMPQDRDNYITGALPYPIILTSAQQIGSQTTGIVPTDAYTSITMVGMRWIDDAY